MFIEYSQEEKNDRIVLTAPIVQGAFSIQGIKLSDEKIHEMARHWEVAFNKIPTGQLHVLYHEGISHQCRTAKEFIDAWRNHQDEIKFAKESK
jgi:hypothetical protein